MQILAGVGARSKEIMKFKSIKIYAFGLCKEFLPSPLSSTVVWRRLYRRVSISFFGCCANESYARSCHRCHRIYELTGVLGIELGRLQVFTLFCNIYTWISVWSRQMSDLITCVAYLVTSIKALLLKSSRTDQTSWMIFSGSVLKLG
jgi:hypothetical protein